MVQTGIGAVAAIGGGFVGAWWQARGQQRIERDRRRDRAAETAAAAIELLQDLDPYRAVEIERSRYKAEVKGLPGGASTAEVSYGCWPLDTRPRTCGRMLSMPLKRWEIVSRRPRASYKACTKPSTRMRSRTPESWPSSTTGQPLTAWSASLKPSNGRDRPDGSVVQ